MIKQIAAKTDFIELGKTQPKQGLPVDTQINTVLTNAVTIIVVVGIIAVLFMFIWGALEWIFSGGDKERLGNARKRIIQALIGLVLLALAFFIVRIIGLVLGFDLTGPFFIPSLGNVTGLPTP